MLEPYAIVTARNVVASLWREQDRHRRNQHRVVDLLPVGRPGRGPAGRRGAVGRRPGPRRGCRERERETLLAHEVAGQDTRSLAGELGSTAGAVAAQLNRTRARLRVEYLLALDQAEPPTRPVPAGPAGPVRRRPPTAARGRRRPPPARVRPVRPAEPAADGARPAARRRAAHRRSAPTPTSSRRARRPGSWRRVSGFSRTDLTLIATAVSEVARNIVRFAGSRRDRDRTGRAAPQRACGSSPGTPAPASPTWRRP